MTNSKTKMENRVYQLLTGEWAIYSSFGSILALYSTRTAAIADLARYGEKEMQS